MSGAQHPAAATVEVICSECGGGFLAPLKRRTGRPRKTCETRCALARNRRLAAEVVEADRAEAARWWLGLDFDQRDAAMAWVAGNPTPPNFRGGRQLWAYFNRAAFSCEQRVVSGVQ